MARTKTLAQLRTALRVRGDWENSQDITDAIILDVLNEAIAEVWDLLIQRWADYYATVGTLSYTTAAEAIALPTTFYKLRKLERLISGTINTADAQYERMYPIDLEASHRYARGATRHYRYRIQAASIYLVPWPSESGSIRITYIPYATELATDADTFDGINGYETLVLATAQRVLLMRQELSTSDVDNEIARLTARVRTAADSRDASEPFYFDPDGPPRDEDDDGWFGWP